MDRAEDLDLNDIVYSKDVLELVTVASEFCGFVEISGQTTSDEFIDKTLKILSLLYLKASMVKIPKRIFDENLEAFVTEQDYNHVINEVVSVIGSGDDYLEVFHPDIQYSDGPIRATVSEDIADIYQYLKNFTTLYGMGSEELMNDGLVECMQYFGQFWGQKLVNVLRALHQLKYQDKEDLFDDEPKSTDQDNYFTRLQKEWGEDIE